jgi:hypothetical protein
MKVKASEKKIIHRGGSFSFGVCGHMYKDDSKDLSPPAEYSLAAGSRLYLKASRLVFSVGYLHTQNKNQLTFN